MPAWPGQLLSVVSLALSYGIYGAVPIPRASQICSRTNVFHFALAEATHQGWASARARCSAAPKIFRVRTRSCSPVKSLLTQPCYIQTETAQLYSESNKHGMNSTITGRKPQSLETFAQSRRNARIQEDFSRGGFSFLSVKDHILPSLCSHPKDQGENTCTHCIFEKLPLPELPEMVFPHNKFVVSFTNSPGSYIDYNAYDALSQVVTGQLPDVQVAPSAAWQATRQGTGKDHSHPFDWTYTTDYAGTLVGCSTEPTTTTIDLERLKQQDEIGFYSQVTLYEDELADHGCAELTVRVRVMPNFFFALMRFYLRIDHVLIRVVDTRLFGGNNTNYIIREWSRREAKVQDLIHLPPETLLDSNQIWAQLPVVASKNDRITPNTM